MEQTRFRLIRKRASLVSEIEALQAQAAQKVADLHVRGVHPHLRSRRGFRRPADPPRPASLCGLPGRNGAVLPRDPHGTCWRPHNPLTRARHHALPPDQHRRSAGREADATAHGALPPPVARQRLCCLRKGERGRIAAPAAEPQRAARGVGWRLAERDQLGQVRIVRDANVSIPPKVHVLIRAAHEIECFPGQCPRPTPHSRHVALLAATPIED